MWLSLPIQSPIVSSQTLAAQDPETQVEILRRFGEADLSTVQRKANFLVGIIRRYSPLPHTTVDATLIMAPVAQEKLQKLIAEGKLEARELQVSPFV